MYSYNNYLILLLFLECYIKLGLKERNYYNNCF